MMTKKRKITIEKLAEMVQRGFSDVMNTMARKDDVDKRFGAIDKRFDTIEKRLEALEGGQEELKTEMREIKYLLHQKASLEDLNDLDVRLTRVEARLRKIKV